MEEKLVYLPTTFTNTTKATKILEFRLLAATAVPRTTVTHLFTFSYLPTNANEAIADQGEHIFAISHLQQAASEQFQHF